MFVKPIKIALFLTLTLLVLFGLTFLSKPKAIKHKNKAEDGFILSQLSIKYPSVNRFLKKEESNNQTVLQKVTAVTTNVVPVEDIKPITPPKKVVDTVLKQKKADPIVKIKSIKNMIDFSKIDSTKIERIQYPSANPNFIKTLVKNFNSNSCRIIHYGDSQLEGDRITSYLRNRLQNAYGGNGPGFIPIKQVYHQLSAKVNCSDNWLRYAMFDRRQKRFHHKKYGSYMSVSRFTPYSPPLADSLAIPLDSIKTQKATIDIAKSLVSYHNFRTFNHIGLHYGEATNPISIKVYNNDVLIQQDSLITDQKHHVYPIKLKETPKNLHIELEGKVSADFYGLTLDSPKGIQIDNVAMRGASGTIFAKSNAEAFKNMTTALNPKLMIMQYGGNTVPYLKDSTAVKRYGRLMVKQINWIKKQTPKAQILYIGPTDMSTSINGNMETYPLLPFLNNTLQKVCLANNVAYWSMYNAMGGKGAMKLWVDQRLAGSDYTHFTPKGTKIISEILFTALYLDLKK